MSNKSPTRGDSSLSAAGLGRDVFNYNCWTIAIYYAHAHIVGAKNGGDMVALSYGFPFSACFDESYELLLWWLPSLLFVTTDEN